MSTSMSVTMCRILSSAFTAAALRGWKGSTLGFRAFVGSTETKSLCHMKVPEDIEIGLSTQ